MRNFSLVLSAAAAMFIGNAALAQPGSDPENGDPSIGVGMICNTQEQAALYLTLEAKGLPPRRALRAVNRQASGTRHACGVAVIAFVRDRTLEMRPVHNKLIQIVRINVVAGFNGSGWQPVSDRVQYAVLEAEGETI
jgi:hypothetical protein